MLAAGERLAAASGIDDVVAVLRETARDAVGAEGVAIILKDGDRCAYVAEDAVSPLWQGQSFPAATCISGWAMRHGETVCIPDVALDPRVPQAAYAPTFVRSLIMTPIGRPEPIAALGAHWSQPADHYRATIARLESLARLATVAIKNARLAQARDRAAALGAAQNRILELAVREAPLKDALKAIVGEVEGLSHGLLGSILLLDATSGRLRHGAAPSLPSAYNEAIDGIAVGPSVGSCGTAAFRGEPVIVSDIATDPLWADFRDLAFGHRLRACWSIPVRSTEGALLGTFAMYHREPRAPQEADLELVDFVVRSVALLIERERSSARLRESEARTSFALKAGRLGAWELDAESLELVASDTCQANFGREAGEPFTYEALRQSVHPDDRQGMVTAVERSLLTGEDYDIDYRVITPAGDVRWVQVRGRPVHNAAGAPVKMAGVSLDITERREAEAALRESEERLRLAVDNADVGFWDVDLVNDILVWPARGPRPCSASRPTCRSRCGTSSTACTRTI